MSAVEPDALRRILEGFTWIKVRRYRDDASLPWPERYAALEALLAIDRVGGYCRRDHVRVSTDVGSLQTLDESFPYYMQ